MGHDAGQTVRVKRRYILIGPGFQAAAVYRFGQWVATRTQSRWQYLLKRLLTAAYYVAAFLMRALYGIHISRSADIGDSLYIGHLGGIRIRHCKIGDGCSIHQQTRIQGNPADGAGSAQINIGNRVWIGPHAIIKAPADIGSGVAIAAGSVVTGTIPPRSLVSGNPARVILRNYDNAALL